MLSTEKLILWLVSLCVLVSLGVWLGSVLRANAPKQPFVRRNNRIELPNVVYYDRLDAKRNRHVKYEIDASASERNGPSWTN